MLFSFTSSTYVCYGSLFNIMTIAYHSYSGAEFSDSNHYDSSICGLAATLAAVHDVEISTVLRSQHALCMRQWLRARDKDRL